MRFNPRPRRGAGATAVAADSRQQLPVSILARAEARALQGKSKLDKYQALFQSSPAPRRGRYLCS